MEERDLLQINERKIKITWIPEKEGGRKGPPTTNKYYCVSKFPNDTSPSGRWSVVFQLFPAEIMNGLMVSFGECRFLVRDAPHENFNSFKKFEIYEGPKKVADVEILEP